MQSKLGTPRSLKWLFAITALLVVAAFFSGCTSSPALSRPLCTWELWGGNPSKDAITRVESLEPIKCTDSKFSDYVCMTGADLKNLLICGGK